MRQLQTGPSPRVVPALPGVLAGVVLTAFFTPARSSFSSIYPFPFPAVRFCLAWSSDALTPAEEDFLKATVASSTLTVAIGNHSRAVWVQNDMFNLHESVLHIFWSKIRTHATAEDSLQSVNTGDLLWAGLSWRSNH